MAKAAYPTVPALAVNVPPVPDTTVGAFVNEILLLPPSSVPAVLVHVPLKVWDNPAPRLRIPAVPFIVKAAPDTFPVNVAVPETFVIDTVPVVVNAPIL